MSALRVPGPDGSVILRIIDDGATPRRSVSGIRGSIGEPVFGVFVTGQSRYSGKVEKRTGSHSPKVRP